MYRDVRTSETVRAAYPWNVDEVAVVVGGADSDDGVGVGHTMRPMAMRCLGELGASPVSHGHVVAERKLCEKLGRVVCVFVGAQPEITTNI